MDSRKQIFAMDPLTYIINHVVLPPKLPQAQESLEGTRSGEQDLLSMIVEVSSEFTAKHADLAKREIWKTVTQMLRTLQEVEANDVLQADKLVATFQAMNVLGSFDQPLSAENNHTNYGLRCATLEDKSPKCRVNLSQNNRWRYGRMFRVVSSPRRYPASPGKP